MKEYEKTIFKSVNSAPNVTPKAVAAINLAAGVNVALWKNGVAVTNGAMAVLVYIAVAYKTKMGVKK